MYYCRIIYNLQFYTMEKRQKVLFVCTGNSCRSQIAEGLLRHLAPDQFEVYSAGSHPSKVHPNAITVMKELSIDISDHTSDSISQYLDKHIDIVITVCDEANKVCPVFPGDAKRVDWSIADRFQGWDTDPSHLDNFRDTIKDIKDNIIKFLGQ